MSALFRRLTTPTTSRSERQPPQVNYIEAPEKVNFPWRVHLRSEPAKCRGGLDETPCLNAQTTTQERLADTRGGASSSHTLRGELATKTDQIRQLQSMVERATPAQTRLEEQLASAQQLVRLHPPNSRFFDLELALADPRNPRLCLSIRLICTRW